MPTVITISTPIDLTSAPYLPPVSPDPTGVYTNLNATIDEFGRVIHAANGAGGGGSGTVTSVGINTDASWLTPAGTPVTVSGILALNLTDGLAANKILATPDNVTGKVALRTLVLRDLPNGSAGLPLLGGVSIPAYGALDLSGAGVTGVLAAGRFPALTGDITTTAGALATTLKNTGTAGTYTKVQTDAQGRVIVGSTLSAGDIPPLAYVTSVGLSLPADLTVSVSPVTSSGNLTAVWANENANVVHAGPASGVAAAPTWRSLVAADIPSLDTSKLTTGQLALVRGGTNADLSGTGGANQFLKQTSLGGAVSVATIAQADLPVFTGDSGTGGVKGAVPAPASGDAAAGKYLAAGGGWSIPPSVSFVTPSISLGTASAAGSAATAIRSDATILAFDVTNPASLAYAGSAAVGAATVAARRDHVHALPAIASADLTTALTTPPVIGGTTPAAGTFTTLGGSTITASTAFVGPIIAPASDGTTAVIFTKADKTTQIAALDTTNKKLIIGTSSTQGQIDFVSGTRTTTLSESSALGGLSISGVSNTLYLVGTVVSDGTFFTSHNFAFARGGFQLSGPFAITDTNTGASIVVTWAHVLNSGTAANNIAADQITQIADSASSAGNGVNAMRQRTLLPNATDATYTSQTVWSMYDKAGGSTPRDVMTIGANGSAATWGLFGNSVAQAATGGVASTFAANTSGIANDTATWDSYTIGQVVKALRNAGILA